MNKKAGRPGGGHGSDGGQSGGMKGLIKELAQYKWAVIGFCLLVVLVSALNLSFPKIGALAIDEFNAGHFDINRYLMLFGVLVGIVFVLSTLQAYFSAYISEKVAFDLRQKIAAKLSKQTYRFLGEVGTDTLLTNITSDIDAIKMVVTMGIPIIFSSAILIVGSFILMFSINWQIALPIMLIVVMMFLSFRIIFSRVAGLFKESQGVLDKLNRVINESIIASALIRVVYGQYEEVKKFAVVSEEAKNVNMKIVGTFATMIPLINFFSNLAVLCVLGWGGTQVIGNTLSLGNFMAFYNYINLLIMPIVILGFVSNVIVRAMASFGRIQVVLNSRIARDGKYAPKEFRGEIEFRDVSLVIKGKTILNKINFKLKAGQKSALIGPTGAGKTLIVYMIAGLISPTEGHVYLDGHKIETYDLDYLQSKIAVVFQDNVIFNSTIKENIVFQRDLPPALMEKVVHTAALDGFVKEHKKGLETHISERGSSLSGGQKQRISLARALAISPQLLLLDDFTARVDLKTEKTIFSRMAENFPDLAILAVSQKIESVKDYDHLILLMEGELLDQGIHAELLERSFEYKQIYSSQQTTNHD